MFRFSADMSLASASTAWTGQTVAFGFGTNPDLILLPEPGTLPMVAAASVVPLAGLAGRSMRWHRTNEPPAA